MTTLLPPLIAIVLAIVSGRVVGPLLIGIAVGIIGFHPMGSVPAVASEVVIDAVFSRDHLLALLFSVALGAMVGVLERGAALRNVLESVARRIRTREGAMRLIAGSGLALFFDDYANTLLVGGGTRSTADRYGISREKLAFLVDATSAPLAGLSVISTWAALEISYMADGLAMAGFERDRGFELFLRSTPYRYYPILTLVFVAAVVITGRDYGPMRRAEADALHGGVDGEPDVAPEAAGFVAAAVAAGPVAVTLVVTLAALVVTGGGRLSAGDSYVALSWGGVAGLIVAAVGHRWGGFASTSDVVGGAAAGAKQMLTAMAILWCAWALSDVTSRIGTDDYLTSRVEASVSPLVLPPAVFVIAAVTAFCTGTSFGAMGLLMPLSIAAAVPLASGTDDPVTATITLATCGSVLAGAIMGDHCSPISDTTVLSSRASGCDHLAHVRTQMPYALTIGAVSIAMLSALPFGMNWAGGLGVGGLLLFAVVRLVGRRPSLRRQSAEHDVEDRG